MTLSTGYEGPEKEEKKEDPTTRKWELSRVHIGTTQTEAVYGNVALDGEIIGSIRFPDVKHFHWFRLRIQGEEE